ncbi:MAG: acylphosphatase [Candidatus Micrarchaeota archaeon]
MKAFVKVYGDVHGVGFRSYTARLAKELTLNGLVKNEVDGSVVVFLDGKKEKIEKFVEIVKSVKCTGFFGPQVDKISVFFEGEKSFKPAWKIYNGFEVDY